jgi:aryl-alcohol dehydrogenase-like predicted oxidoreductase
MPYDRSMIARAPFGATGHDSSRVIFGAAALGSVSKGDADRTLDLLLQHGINHIDVAASYGDAELRIAPWLRRDPDSFFLATKTGPRVSRSAGPSTGSASTGSTPSSCTTWWTSSSGRPHWAQAARWRR